MQANKQITSMSVASIRTYPPTVSVTHSPRRSLTLCHSLTHSFHSLCLQGCLDSSCDAMALPPLSTKQQHAKQQQQQQQPHFKRVYPPPVPDTNSSSSIAATQQQQKQGDRAVSADGASEGVSQGRGSGVGGFFTSLLQQAATAPATGNGSTNGVTTRSGRRRAASDSAAAAAPAGDEAAVAAAGGSSSSSPVSGCVSGHRLINSACLLFKREVALGRQYGFSRTQQTHMQCARTLPLYPQKVRESHRSTLFLTHSLTHTHTSKCTCTH